jgi:transposase
MHIVYPRCCGLDVHKASVSACILITEPAQTQRYRRRFATMTGDILSLGDWLSENGVTHLAMESTGVYWKPIWNLLEGRVEMLLVNAQHIKAVPGRKTDLKDCEWIAELLQHGLLRGSFVPPPPIQELRDLNRNRAILVQQRATVSNRIEKVLEDANIKLASVASHVLGQSGRAMLQAMADGEVDPEKLAGMARAKLRNKIPELRLALRGRFEERHRFQVKELLDQLHFLDARIAEFGQQIEQRSRPFAEKIARLMTIPGVDEITASSLLAEIGDNMTQFPSAGHLASWAGLCPGNNESAGKHYSGKTRKGDAWLRRVLCQAAWAASHTKNTYLAALYRRLASKKGKQRAIVAVGHSILVAAYHMLKRNENYQEAGGDYFDRVNPDSLRRYLVRRLERLGHRVALLPATPAG